MRTELLSGAWFARARLGNSGQLLRTRWLAHYHIHLERVDVDPKGLFRFFPFVVQPGPSEPKTIEINPWLASENL